MPLGLMTIAAALKQKKINTLIYQPKIRLIHEEDYIHAASDILSLHPKIIGFSTWCISYPASILIARALKKLSTEISVIFGGPQASVMAEETLKTFSFVDFVLIGEADKTFPLFIDEFRKKNPCWNKISGLVYRNENEIKRNPGSEWVKNPDELPVPDYNFMNENQTLKLDVGRGCPFHCTFCSTSNFFRKKYRVKSAQRILHEMKLAYSYAKIVKFSFAHDMFTLNRKFISELCNSIIHHEKRSGIKFTWSCSSRLDCINRKMISKMSKAGCLAIFFGVESGSPKIQKSIRKNLKLKRAFEAADWCRETGTDMHASFIVGFPEETIHDLEQTLQCALKLALKGALVQISILSLLPGTVLFRKYQNQLKLDGRFSNFSGTICGAAELEMINQYPWIFSSFYYLPVETLNRGEMLYLSQLINNLQLFRNTLFLLKSLIKEDIKEKNLLGLFKEAYSSICNEKKTAIPPVSRCIRLLHRYIQKNMEFVNPDIFGVFAFESFQALLTTRFTRIQLILPDSEQKEKQKDFTGLHSTPFWKLLSTSFKLNKIIPAENGWNNKKIRKRKGRYYYLLVAESESTCRRYEITAKDAFLLEHLDSQPMQSFLSEMEKFFSPAELDAWIKKMHKLNVLNGNCQSFESYINIPETM